MVRSAEMLSIKLCVSLVDMTHAMPYFTCDVIQPHTCIELPQRTHRMTEEIRSPSFAPRIIEHEPHSSSREVK